jgi:2,3-bisphosphoglycerate-independent phosphoglycerate mutase
MVTADHGNAEQLLDAQGNPHTAHSMNPVPVALLGAPAAWRLVPEGKLGDVAPTIIDILGLHRPEAMTGQSLLVKESV